LVLSSYDIAAFGVIIGVLVAAATMAGFFQAVGESESIPLSTKRQLRRNVVLLGPVAMIQLLVYTYFPKSRFSGLGEPTDASQT
jgi:H+/Cl- antiporter ClcA